MVSQTETISTAADLSKEQIKSVSVELSDQSNKMQEVTQETLTSIRSLDAELQERVKEFFTVASSSDEKIKGLETTVGQIGKNFEDISNKGTVQVYLASEKLKGAFAEIADYTEKVGLGVQTAGENLIRQSDIMNEVADKALKKMKNLDEQMKNSMTDMMRVSDHVSGSSLKLGGAFTRQIQALVMASKTAEGYVTLLGKKQSEHSADRFIKDAGLILDNLQNLSIDIARLFSPETEEELWKKYYAGDHTAFMRYLSKTMDQEQINRIRNLFEKDEDFRGYASRYMSEFESITEKAKENSRSDVLMALLIGSDVGRLYMVLSKALNKK